jgi:cyclopropane-fatty-acyl-phospholipid synthase
MNATTSAIEPKHSRADPSTGVLGWAERGLLPDALVRLGIRALCRRRLAAELSGDVAEQAARFQAGIESLRQSPIAVHTDAANAQHYELPPAFFQSCLGKRMKYSCAYFEHGNESLDQAEEAMLERYAERAQLRDGQNILELGCGWGSLTLWMAERYPHAEIHAVSNSRSQREFIEAECRRRRLGHVRVTVEDVNRLRLPAAHFDRCVSVEMLEHIRNYQALLAKIGSWLAPGGKLFVHIFSHRSAMYPFEISGEDDWMGKYFFTGGLMPSVHTLLWFQQDLRIESQWLVEGTHYERTANCWLARMDANRESVMTVLADSYGADNASIWFRRWRMFYMACAELFGYSGGREWLVSHYRFVRPA